MQGCLILINTEREGTEQDIWAVVSTDSGKAVSISFGKRMKVSSLLTTDYKMTQARKTVEKMLPDFAVPNR